MADNHITKVAIVGAGGRIGSFITSSLLQTGKHTITAITRADSTSTFPSGVERKVVDYEKPETITEALRGQDALVITLSGQSPMKDLEAKLITAAAEAEVPWIMPNEWSPDSTNEGYLKDVFIFESKVAARKLIKELGKSSYISLSTGFWYEWSLGIAKCYGFDFEKRSVRFYDYGETKISTSTWPQVGRAVAAILSLPIKPEGSNPEACLNILRNRVVCISSFLVSQKDMLESVLRVSGTKGSDWTITKRTSKEMYEIGMKDMKNKNWQGEGNFLYGRVFYPDGAADFEHKKINGILGLPREDIDEATTVAIERQKTKGGYS